MLLPFVFAFLLQAQPLSTICPAFGVPVTGGGYDFAGGVLTEYVFDADAIAAVVEMIQSVDETNTFFLGYDAGGWSDSYKYNSDPVLEATLWLADGSERQLAIRWSPDTPTTYYVTPYSTVEPYADANGEHFGTHPCAAFTISADAFARLLATLEET